MKNTTAAERLASEFAMSMERAGYDPSDAFEKALREEFATIIEFDKEENEDAPEGSRYNTIPYFLDALANAAQRSTTYRN